MKRWWPYSLETGRFTGAAFHVSPCTPERVAALTPAGHAVVEADHIDALSQCMDLQAQPPAVVDYRPPAPADSAVATWSWDEEARRWAPTLTPEGRKPALLQEAQRQMAAAEAAAQDRPAREMLLALLAGTSPPAAALARLQAVDDQLTALRAVHTAITTATTHTELDAAAAQLAAGVVD